MTEPKSVDATLVAAMQNQQAPIQPVPSAPIPHDRTVPNVESNVSHGTVENTESDNLSDKESKSALDMEQNQPDSNINLETTNSSDNGNKLADDPIDEYGNPVEPPKMYSEDDVQRIIRERLARAKFPDQAPPTQREIQQRADDFKADPNSEETWETQLEAFVEKTIEKRQSKQAEQQWKEQEAKRQAEFESKFTTGMNKYQDFHQVVAATRESITDTMMLATRSLENPAAFIYGASKMHPQELTRISRIGDPYVQAVEVGRLHEKMVKTNRMVSNAPKPLEAAKSDIAAKRTDERPPIDYLIQQHAKQKMARK